eukprot:431802_1
MAALIPLCVYLMLLQAVSFTRFNITEETKLQTMNWSSIMCVDKQPKSNNKPISSIILYCKYDDMYWIISSYYIVNRMMALICILLQDEGCEFKGEFGVCILFNDFINTNTFEICFGNVTVSA